MTNDTTSVSLAEMLPPEAIRLDVDAADWRTCIETAGDLLVATGAATPAYTQAMIDAVERFGPYIVIAPGLALAHAQASDAVHRSGLSLVRLRTPVAFGHKKNDPVTLVVGLCSPNHDAHIAALQHLAVLLTDKARRAEIDSAQTVDELRSVLLSDPSPAKD